MPLPTKDKVLVGIQVVLLIVYIFPLGEPLGSFEILGTYRFMALAVSLLGLAVMSLALIQLNQNLTPFPTPKQKGYLVNTGLYKYIRHPVYTGILIFVWAWAIYRGSYWKLLISFILTIFFYLKSIYEEALLSKKYSDYSQYRHKSGRFLPKL
ncbi:MAG: methyltransferase family protein [Runella sp.]